MKKRLYFAIALMLVWSSLCAQTYHYTFSHDTLGNRVSRVYQGTRSSGVDASSSLGKTQSPVISTGLSEWRDLDEKYSETAASLIAGDTSFAAKDTVKHSPLVKSPAEKEAYLQAMMDEVMRMQALGAHDRAIPVITASVGEIPLSYGLSGSGARTYSIPIYTAPDIKYAPSLSLVYNSQGGYGYGGYGWNIGGLSAITLTGKSLYWDNMITAASTSDSDGVFCLDGVRLVTNTDQATSDDYPLVTASGHILAAPRTANSGYIKAFDVLYPDGTQATYGFGVSLGFTLPSYPLVSSTNAVGEKIEYCYSLDTASGNHAIDSVRYGINAAGHAAAVIRFTADTSAVYSYYAGKKAKRSPRVSVITSSSSGNTLYTYSLAYQTYPEYGNLTLLESVSLTNASGESLTPLTFTYGAEAFPHQGADSLKVSATRSFAQVVPGGTGGFALKRGKFLAGNYDDGLLAIRNLPLYYEVSDGKYECGYEPTGVYPTTFAYVDCISNPEQAIAMPAYDRFQGADAVDTDGDGIDEIVTIRCGEPSVFSQTTTIYADITRFDASGDLLSSRTVFDQFSGVIDNRMGLSPCRRTYRWGDFLGYGRAQLLAVCYTDNGFGESQTPYAALFDPYAGAKVFDGTFSGFQISTSQDSRLLCLDIDGDSRTEVCLATSDGLKVYRCYQGGMICAYTIPDITVGLIESGRTYYADLNSDGYIDIIQAPAWGSWWTRYTNTGESFVQDSVQICSVSAGDGYIFLDIDRDGYPDLMKVSGSSLGFYPNVDGMSFGIYKSGNLSVTTLGDILPANVVDYTSMSSFVTVDGTEVREFSYTSYVPPMRHLVQSSDSYGKKIRNTYRYLPQACGYWTDAPSGIDSTQGYQLRILPLYVLTGAKGFLSASDTSNVFLQDTYAWYDGVVNTRGLGFCGFSKTRRAWSLDAVNRAEVVRYDPQRRGIPVSTSVHPLSDSHPAFSETTFTYDNHSTQYGKLQPRLLRSSVTKSIDGVLSTTLYSYDTFDFPVSTSTRRYATGMTTAVDSTVTVYQHSNSPLRYILGGVASQTVIHERDGDGVFRMGEKAVFSLDTILRPLVRHSYKLQMAAGTMQMQQHLASTDRWQYDSHGNVIREESASAGSAVFVGNSYTYDSSGRHLVSSTDALGHATTYSGFDIYGNPAVTTNHKNQQTHTYRDGWGRVTRTVHPDGIVDSIQTYWGLIGKYAVARRSTGQPDVTVEYDAAGREVYRAVQRFDGQWQKVKTIYNKRGLALMASLPYRGTSPSHWNQYQYDSYGRTTRIIEASGRKTTWTYSGTAVTERKDGVRTVRRKGSSGDLISVSDSLSTVTYIYRDDGQPSSTSVTGGVATYFSYDTLGRRLTITDPSAGTRTTAYATNANGYTVVSETNAIGSVVTTSDSLGRVVSIARPDFSTVYSYDTCGRIVSVVSTSGTLERYTYDAYDRVVTARDSVPDGKWLQKAYTYNADGQVATIAYTSQGGYITTETYSYTNGYNTSITLPDNTVVFSLTSENDLGQPTAATTASVSRTYSYTDYGLPTFRKMDNGALQQFTYNFDAATGNLTSRSRKNGNNTISESFTYDNIGRLTGAGGNAIAYDAKNNITSKGGVGTMSYNAGTRPYNITGLETSSSATIGTANQGIFYTAYDRPYMMMQGLAEAYFTYDAKLNRVKMLYYDTSGDEGANYYVGDRYEIRRAAGTTTDTQLLYLGGDAYSAPMVLRKQGGGSWTPYVIGRDYLGSITHIATTGGTLVEERSYDAWGRLRDPATNAAYDAASQPSLFLGRGWCGHEYLADFGLYNLNARLYDPVIGRFLSPDPYVQAPDNPANFNRYSYCLNNPLKYTDKDGESLLLAMGIGAAIFGIGNLAAHALRKDDLSNWMWAKYFFSGALAGAIVGAACYGAFLGATTMASTATTKIGSLFWEMTAFNTQWAYPITTGVNLISSGINGLANKNDQWLSNFAKTTLGNFYLDENKSFFGEVWEGISRHTWEAPQQLIGYAVSSLKNGWNERVDLFGGATFGTYFNGDAGPGCTIGSYININSAENILDYDAFHSFDDYLMGHSYMADEFYLHEYGHTIQSKKWGPLYMIPAALSLYSALTNTFSVHNHYWVETAANRYSLSYFNKHFVSFAFPTTLFTK